jgi:uncharacterized membrane protein SirB2
VLWLKQAHVVFALLSLSGFVLRGYWMMGEAAALQRRWVKIVPHVVDTLLLLSGIALIVSLGLYPTQQPWLAAKLVALLLYIVLGAVALRRGKTYKVRVGAFFGALVVFAYITAAAFTHQPLPV